MAIQKNAVSEALSRDEALSDSYKRTMQMIGDAAHAVVEMQRRIDQYSKQVDEKRKQLEQSTILGAQRIRNEIAQLEGRMKDEQQQMMQLERSVRHHAIEDVKSDLERVRGGFTGEVQRVVDAEIKKLALQDQIDQRLRDIESGKKQFNEEIDRVYNEMGSRPTFDQIVATVNQLAGSSAVGFTSNGRQHSVEKDAEVQEKPKKVLHAGFVIGSREWKREFERNPYPYRQVLYDNPDIELGIPVMKGESRRDYVNRAIDRIGMQLRHAKRDKYADVLPSIQVAEITDEHGTYYISRDRRNRMRYSRYKSKQVDGTDLHPEQEENALEVID